MLYEVITWYFGWIFGFIDRPSVPEKFDKANIIQEKDYNVWGTNILKGKDGKYHVITSYSIHYTKLYEHFFYFFCHSGAQTVTYRVSANSSTRTAPTPPGAPFPAQKQGLKKPPDRPYRPRQEPRWFSLCAF